MPTLLERSEQALPVTEVSRSAKRIIDSFTKGEKEKYVVMRNNSPAAVLMSVRHYEDLMDLIDDLKLEVLAQQRLKSFDPKKVLSHKDMVTFFERKE